MVKRSHFVDNNHAKMRGCLKKRQSGTFRSGMPHMEKYEGKSAPVKRHETCQN